MAQGTGLSQFQQLYPDRFFDVGIAEQHAVTFAAGLAAAGLRPVAAIYSTFLQRSIDQIIHDVALQKLPVIFALDRAGAVPYDGETHQGFYDISLLRSVPNMIILCPASAVEMDMMFRWAAASDLATVLRYPKSICPADCPVFHAPLELGRGIVTVQTEKPDILLVCTGGMYQETASAADILLRRNIFADIYNIRFAKPVDESYFLACAQGYRAVLFIEDGAAIGGIAQYLESILHKHRLDIKTAVCAFADSIFLQGSRNDILEAAGMSSMQLADAASALCRNL